MRIPIEKFETIINFAQYQFQLEKIDIATTQTISLKDGQITQNFILTNSYLQDLKQRQIPFVSIIIPEEALQELRTQHADIFSKPQASIPFSEFMKEFDQFTHMNKLSRKKRRFFLCKDMYIMGNTPGRYELVTHFGDEIDDTIMKGFLKADVSQNTMIDYRENENGILFYQGDCSDEIKNQIISLLQKTGYEIYMEKDPIAAIRSYLTLNPKMVVSGPVKTSQKTKEFFIYLQDIDPFCIFHSFSQPPSENNDEELFDLLSAYKQNYGPLIEAWQTKEKLIHSEELKELTEAQKIQFLDRIREIQQLQSKTGLINLLYIIHNLKDKYQIHTIELKLKRLKYLLPLYRKQ